MRTQEKPTRPDTMRPGKPRRGLLIAAAAFVAVLVVVGIAALLLNSNLDDDVVDTTTTTIPSTTAGPVVDAARLEAAAAAASSVAVDAGYEAIQQPWQPQLTFVTGGPDCQLESDPVQFTELDTLTAGQTMVSMTLGSSVGAVEVLQFADLSVAEEAAPIFDRLLASRRACMAAGLQSQLGNAFGSDEFTTIDIEGALGAYLFSSEHDDGSGRVAHVQVLGAIEGEWLYIVTFRSNESPVDGGLIEDLFNAVRGA